MWSVKCKNENNDCLHFLIKSPDPYFTFSFPKYNPATVRNILMVLDRIIEQVNAKSCMQE